MSDFKHLLPPSATPSARAVEVVMAERIQGLDEPIGKLGNVDTCPEALLPWLAWSFSVEVWDHAWPVKTKRSVIRNSISVHRRKGTRRAVQDALDALGVSASIIEWWESAAQPGAEPSTFEIWLDLVALLVNGADPEITIEQLRQVVDAAKPVSAHYTAHAKIAASAREYGGCASVVSGRVRNRAGIPDAPIIAAAFNSGALSRATGHLQSPYLGAPS